MALTPGGVDQDLIRLGHHKIDRPMFPFDPDMADPESARSGGCAMSTVKDTAGSVFAGIDIGGTSHQVDDRR